jgi:hypothetical protein
VTSVKRKLIDILTDDDEIKDALPEDDLIEDDFMVNDNFTDNHAFAIEEDAPSSDIEFVNHVKPVVVKTESEPVSLRVTSAVVSFGYYF